LAYQDTVTNPIYCLLDMGFFNHILRYFHDLLICTRRLLTVLLGGAIITGAIGQLKSESAEGLKKRFGPSVIVWLSFSAASDLIITISLVWYLVRMLSNRDDFDFKA
jgi:hypothetical protein